MVLSYSSKLSTNTKCHVKFSIYKKFRFPTLRSIIFSTWQAVQDSNPNNKLYKLFPKLQHFSQLHQSYTTNDQTILNRLFIGHTPLTHSYLFNKEQPPSCDHCKCLLTVEHILTKYTAYKQVREKYHQHSQLSHISINAPKQCIFNFLNEIKLFKNFNFCRARYSLFVLKVPLNSNQPTRSSAVTERPRDAGYC